MIEYLVIIWTMVAGALLSEWRAGQFCPIELMGPECFEQAPIAGKQ